MPTINGRACVVNGTPVDKVFSDGRQVYGRNLLTGTSTPVQATGNGGTNNAFTVYTFGGKILKDIVQAGDSISLSFDWSVAVQGSSGTLIAQLSKAPWGTTMGPTINVSSGSGHYSTTTIADANWATSLANGIQIRLDGVTAKITISNMKFEIGTIVTPWTPAPEDVM